MFQERIYQTMAVDAIYSYFDTHTGNPVVAMPTGTGKSVVIARFAHSALSRWNSQRFMFLTHVQELIEQNAKALVRAWPEAPIGIYSAALGKKETDAPITFGGIASVNHDPGAFGHIDMLGIDECHLLSSGGDTMYQNTIAVLRERNPYLKVTGFSATPYRMGQGLITDNPRDGKRLFTDFAIDMTGFQWFNWFIDQGYLAKLVTMPTDSELDVSGVGMSGGDFNGKALTDKLDGQDKEHYNACREMVARGFNRRAWLVFTAGIERSEWVADTLNTLGVKSTFVHSRLEKAERTERVRAYRAGEYQCMVGNNVFTTGFDYSAIDLIGMLRPTRSTGLWVQMLGRGTRPLYAPGSDLNSIEGRLWAIQMSGKLNCLVLDFAGNARELGPVNDPVLPHKKGAGGGEIPMKICGHCGCYQHLSARVCDNCMTPFPPGTILTHKAFSGDILRTEEPKMEWFNVTAVIYRVHQKGGGKPMVRVTYACGFRSFEEWVCIEHDKYLGKKARDWWRTRVTPKYLDYGPPPTAIEFVEWKHLLKSPRRIYVQTNKQYPEVQNYEYE
jgi:DNA repair protein RadD